MTVQLPETEEECEHAVLALIEQGVSINAIAKRLHIGKRKIARVRKRHGLAAAAAKVALTAAEQRLALELLEGGASYKEVGRTMGRSAAHLGRKYPGYAWSHQACGKFTRTARAFEGIA